MSRPTVVLVTGSGRSGTSSVAGTLKRLGLHIPPPEVEADEANPRGYYEPLWVTEFHKDVLNPVPVRTIDTRPTAAAIAHRASATPEIRTRLRDWLAGHLDAEQLLIKDPRAFWVMPLWLDVAAELDVDLVTLTMLRHPTEVVRSRDRAYLSDKPDTFRRQRETANIAAWVNAAFETELATRGRPRAFVRYVDLLADWRAAMIRAGEQLGLTYPTDLRNGEPHEVDEFIDVRLNRSEITWDDLAVEPRLRELADQTWSAMNSLVEDPTNGEAMAELGRLREEYVEVFEYAEAVAMDATTEKVTLARREIRRRKDGELAAMRKELHDLQRENAALQTSLTNRIARNVRRLRG